MTSIAVNALYRYFETLYSLNQNLIVLCGTNAYDHQSEQEQRIDEVMMAIPRLVPYSFDRKSGVYVIDQADGLMEFSGDLPFLSADYDNILQNHKDFLEKTKKVRNKLEHKMHGARIVASSSGSISLFAVKYDVAENEVEFCASEIIAFVKDMNILFSRIQELVRQFTIKQQCGDHPYCWRLIRYSYSDFNKIYESDILHIFGKALLPF